MSTLDCTSKTADPADSLPLHSPQVHQATGMIAAQLDVPLEEAFVRLRARAFTDHRPLAELAADVVARWLRFGPTSEARLNPWMRSVNGPYCGASTEVITIGDERLLDTFVELADTLIDDFDVIDFLHLLVDRCVALLDVDAAGLLLANQHGQLQLIATSNEQVRLLELVQLQNDKGPCLEGFRDRYHDQPH